MTNNQLLTKFLREESAHGKNLITINKETTADYRKVVYMALSDGLLHPTPKGTAYRFTKKAHDILEEGITYDEYIKKTKDIKPWWHVWGKKLLEYLIPALLGYVFGKL